MFRKSTKQQLRKHYVRRAAWSKQDMEYCNKLIYKHMKLQAEGVKYTLRSSDTTYHGRQAIHYLMAYELSQKIYFGSLEKLEKLYS